MQRNFFPDLDSHLKTGYEDEDAATIATTRAGRLRTGHRSTANSVPHTSIGSPAGSRSLTPSASVKFKRLVLSEGFDTLDDYGEYREEGVDDDEEDYVRIIDSVEDDEDEEYVPYTTRTTPGLLRRLCTLNPPVPQRMSQSTLKLRLQQQWSYLLRFQITSMEGLPNR